jgi:glycine cleavage system H protein
MKFTKEHEWVTAEGGTAKTGITDFAQKSLGDIVFVELPEVGAHFDKGDVIGTVESVKTVSDVYSPVSGEVTAVNTALEDDPAAVNNDAYGSWIAEIKLDDAELPEGLMDEAEYADFCKEEH